MRNNFIHNLITRRTIIYSLSVATMASSMFGRGMCLETVTVIVVILATIAVSTFSFVRVFLVPEKMEPVSVGTLTCVCWF